MVDWGACKRCGHLKISHRLLEGTMGCVALLPPRDPYAPAHFCPCPDYQDPEEPDRVEPS